MNIKLSSILVVLLIGCIITVGYNVVTVSNNQNEEFLNKNYFPLALETASRLGLVQTLEIIGSSFSDDSSSVWQNERFLREFNNVLYDWYAPIKWSPVLSISKEAGWLVLKARVKPSSPAKKANNSTLSSAASYGYVKSDALNVRSGPSANNGVIATLSKNTRIEILSKTGVWWKIKYGTMEGFVNSEFVSDR
jgi:uncharacterized protein YgiM (DUF1202 family)